MTAPLEGLTETEPQSRVLRWELCNEARANAVSPAVLRRIAARCSALSGEVVVLTGAGTRAFCSGFDLTLLQTEGGTDLPDAPLLEATAAMRCANATFVAAIGGHAVGAGVELACACDLRIAVDSASFRIPAARLGVVYHAAGLASIRAAFGPALAARLLLAGDLVSAQEAFAGGALSRIVSRSELEPAVDALVDALRRGAPQSLAGNRTLLRHLNAAALDAAVQSEHEQRRTTAYASADHHEARAALAAGRPPRFTGK